jgi:hypothetical protein
MKLDSKLAWGSALIRTKVPLTPKTLTRAYLSYHPSPYIPFIALRESICTSKAAYSKC